VSDVTKQAGGGPAAKPADPTSGAADKPVELSKKPAGAVPAGARPQPPKVPIPLTVHLATIAIAVQIVCTLVRALALRGYTSELSSWLVEMNGKAKNPVKDYNAGKVAHDLEQLRSGALIQAIVLSLALAILALSLRRARGASGARWALIIILVLTSGPLAVVPVAGWPLLPKAAGVGMGVASIAVIVLILLPKSMAYFRACKEATRPAGAAPRPGLAALFRPRPHPAAAQRSGTPAATAERAELPVRRTPKAKVRADADAVARGAEIARARAKASKSRRTPDV
jgi:hypothetical protein